MPAYPEGIETLLTTDQFETPSNDTRSYKLFKLQNGLEVLAVHDAHTDVASAAMDVNVGYFSDPKDMQGLAHAVERLVSMGTEKYPAENDLLEYVSKYSGKYNAHTSGTSTNYHFEVGPDAFYGALDRFSQMFLRPLFNAETIDKVLRNVDSEHRGNRTNSQMRVLQVQKSTSNPNHGWSNLKTGTSYSFKTAPEARGLNVRDSFVRFHQENYIPNIMRLVMLGKEPLNELEKMAEDLFAEIPNKSVSRKPWEAEVPLRPEDLMTQCFVEDKNWKLMEIEVPFKKGKSWFESQPDRYITHLINHKGLRSMVSELRSKGWATDVSTVVELVCASTPPGIFRCRIYLTEDGVSYYKEVVKLFFGYNHLIQQELPQKWRFDELQKMADYAFRFQEKTVTSQFTRNTSAIMQRPIPGEWLLGGHTRLRKFDPEQIKEFQAYIRPDNFRLTIISPNCPGVLNKMEEWYETKYSLDKIPDDFLAEIRSSSTQLLPGLCLPGKNLFIPRKLELNFQDQKQLTTEPTLIQYNDGVRLWYKWHCRVPKANLFIHFRSALSGETAKLYAKTYIYAAIVTCLLDGFASDWELAQAQCQVRCEPTGMLIMISSWSESLPTLLDKVLTAMKSLPLDQFEIVKDRLSQVLGSTALSMPWHQASLLMTSLDSTSRYPFEQIVAELLPLAEANMKKFYPKLLEQMHTEIFLHGNMDKKDALSLGVMVKDILMPRPLPRVQWPIARSRTFLPGSNFIYHRTIPASLQDHAVVYFLYFGDRFDKLIRAKAYLFRQMIRDALVDQLQRKENPGCTVFSTVCERDTTIGLEIIVQGNQLPQVMEDRIDYFLVETAALIQASEIELHKKSAVGELLEKPNNSKEESRRFWAQIYTGRLDFKLDVHVATQVERLTLDDMTKFYEHSIRPSSPMRAKVSVWLEAQEKGVECVEGKNFKLQYDGTPHIFSDPTILQSMTTVGAGPDPVKDIKEFEDLDATGSN